MNEWTASNRGSGATAAGRGQANDPHLNVAASYFTCSRSRPAATDPFSFDTAYKFNALPIGSSLDHVMAQQLSPNGTPLFMRVGNRMDGAQSGISYLKDATAAANAAAKAYPGLGSPSQVFSALMGLFDKGGTGGGMTRPATYALSPGPLVCDLVKDDLAALKRLPHERGRTASNLAMWETLCNEMGTIVTSNVCTTPWPTDRRNVGERQQVGQQHHGHGHGHASTGRTCIRSWRCSPPCATTTPSSS